MNNETMDMYQNYQNQNNNNLNDSFLSRRGNDIINNSYNPRQDIFYNNNNNYNYNNNMQNNIQSNMQPRPFNNNQIYMNPIPFQPPNDNFNQNMNNIVKDKLMSRGVVMTKNSNSPVINKNFDINTNDTERKKMLLNNFQQQINMTKNNKLLDLEKKRKEDEKYLQDIQNFYPFGRGGAGAPIRDKNGQLQTTRKALISDPKYQHVAINVEDDYEDTNKNSKMYGLINYNRNIQSNYQNNNNLNYNQNGAPFSNRIPSGRNYYQSNTGPNFQPINGSNYQPLMPIYNNYNPLPYENNQYNNPPYQNYYDNYNNYNNNPINPPPMINEYIPPMQPQNIQHIPNMQQPTINYSDPAYNNPNKLDLQISYKNNEVDDDLKKKEKFNYGNYLREQMEIDRKKKEQEKELKKKEDYEEELRVKRQLEILKQQEESEKEKKKKEIEKLENDNEKLKHNVMSKRKKINYEEEFQNSNNNKELPNNNVQIQQQQPYNNFPPQISQEENLNYNYNNNYQPQQVYHQPSQEELEIRQNLNNEILNLRSNFQDQQNLLLKQINDLKLETQNANSQRYEVIKEFDSLKEEISKQRIDEEMRRKYVYDVLVDNNNKVSNVYSNTRLNELDQKNFKVDFDNPKNHQKNLKNMYYDETIKHPNRIRNIPNLNEIKEHDLVTSSKFIDVDTHNIVDSLNIYQPTKKDPELEKIKSKGFALDDNFEPLNSFHKEKNFDNDKYFYEQKSNYEKITQEPEILPAVKPKREITTPSIVREIVTPSKNRDFSAFVKENINFNKKVMSDDNLSINQIYNKNLERLRYLSNLEKNIFDEDKYDTNLEDVINSVGSATANANANATKKNPHYPKEKEETLNFWKEY